MTKKRTEMAAEQYVKSIAKRGHASAEVLAAVLARLEELGR